MHRILYLAIILVAGLSLLPGCKEKEAHAYYITLAANSDDEAMRDIFYYLAEEELTHRRMLEIELKLYTGEMPLARPVEAIPGVYRDWW